MRAQRASQPFGHTTANLASGGVCSTARLLRRDLLVKTAHHQHPVKISRPHLTAMAPHPLLAAVLVQQARRRLRAQQEAT